MLEKFNRITESFFLTALGCYLAYAAISATTFQLPLPAKTLARKLELLFSFRSSERSGEL